MRAATYLRVSEVTETNISGSMEDQLRACEGYAARAGWVTGPALLYREEGRSAYKERTLKRPELQRALADAQAHRFDVLLVYKLDRFSRRVRLCLEALEAFGKAGVTVVSATEPSDYTTAGGRFSVHTLAAASQFFSDALSERIKTRRAAEAAEGRHLGPAPLGYAHAGQGALVRAEPQGQLVIAGLTRYATGQHSAAQVARELRQQGHTMPGGRPITAEAIRRLVENAPVYAGQVKAGGLWIPGAHEPIISAEMAEQVQAVAARRSVAHQRRYARTAAPDALLAGLCFCESCRQDGRASKLHYHTDARLTPPWRAFRCKTKADGGPCDEPYSPAEPLEQQVLALCDGLALPDEWLHEALELARAQLRAPVPRPAVDRAAIEGRVRRLATLYADGVLPDAEYRAQLESLRAQLAEAPAPMARRRVTLEDVAARLRDIPGLVRQGSVQERRAALGELFDEIYVARGNIAAVRPTEAYEAMVQAAHISATSGGHLSAWRNPDRPLVLLPARAEGGRL